MRRTHKARKILFVSTWDIDHLLNVKKKEKSQRFDTTLLRADYE